MTLQPRRHIALVEGARGFAAAFVVVQHLALLFFPRSTLPDTAAIRLLMDCLEYFGIDAVMLFFLLSGFSIHYAHVDRMASTFKGARAFLYLRVRRLYPIFLIAVITGLLSLWLAETLTDVDEPWWSHVNVLASLGMITDLPHRVGHWFAVMPSNGPLWSLSYEALYYLVYPVFWQVARSSGIERAVLYAGLLSMAAMAIGEFLYPNHLSNVFGFYILWALGALLGEMVRRRRTVVVGAPLYFMVTLLACQILWPLEAHLTWHIKGSYEVLCGLALFVLMAVFVCDLREAHWSGRQRIALAIFTLAFTAGLAWIPRIVALDDREPFYQFRVISTSLVAVAWLSNYPQTIKRFFRGFLAPWHSVGGYSYALYVLHYPILKVAATLSDFWFDSVSLGVIALAPVIAITRFIERRVQPRMSALMDRAFRKTPRVNALS